MASITFTKQSMHTITEAYTRLPYLSCPNVLGIQALQYCLMSAPCAVALLAHVSAIAIDKSPIPQMKPHKSHILANNPLQNVSLKLRRVEHVHILYMYEHEHVM
jgi:hypothetical protein